MEVQNNPEHQSTINQEIISQLSSSERYFLVYPHPFENLSNPLEQDQQPLVLVYKNDDNITVKQLLKRYNLLIKGTDRKEAFVFQTKNKLFLDQSMTIGNLKSKLRREDIDGFPLYSDDSLDQCAAINFIYTEKQCYLGKISVPYQIEQAQYFNYVYVEPKTQIQALLKQICKDIQRDMGKMISPEQIYIELKDKNNRRQLYQGQINELKASSQLFIQIKGTQLKYTYKGIKNHLILNYKGYQPKNIEYPMIRGKKVIDILKTLDNSKDWTDYALLIQDYILTKDDKIETYKQIEQLFTPINGVINHIQGQVLSEINAFQKSKLKISKLPKLDIKEYVEKDQKNTQYRQKCQTQIRKRAQMAPLDFFKDEKNVQPIFLYTSQLKVKGSKEKSSSIYRNMNQLLRTQSFAHIPQSQFSKKWEYKFMQQLLQQLDKIQKCQEKPLYRGVSYRPDYKIGDKILFKQFNSTSIKKQTAMAFANQALLEIEQSHSGKCIFDYSYYKTEKEVLFPPYTQFEVTHVGEISNEKKKKNVQHIKLKEIKHEKLEENIINFVLWVDDKTIEGKAIWNKFEHIKKSTLMMQILSTEELGKWLVNHRSVLENPSTQISMISNMTRFENEVKNEYAGVDAIKVLRKNLPKGYKQNIFLYVGNKKLAVEKLQKHDLKESQTLQVSSAPSRLKEFLKLIGVQ